MHQSATKEQQKLIEELVRDFPETKDSFEYRDYISKPSKGTASEFISRAIDDNVDLIGKRENYVEYIAKRPRAERRGSHGLFTDADVPINLSKVAEEVANHDGNVWTHIISLRREDAARLGYDNAYAWRNLLRSQAETIAENMKIPLTDLRWYAAYHDESYHPHVHMVVYSAGKEPYLTKLGIEGITIRFKEGLVTGEETEGQRLGINTSSDYSTQRGSRFTDVVVENVGTGICSGIANSVLGREGEEDELFSVTFDKFTVKDFSFRGMDFRSGARTGNYFKDITLSSGKYRADAAVYWTGEESETAIGKLTVKDTIAETPIYLNRLHGLSAEEVVLDNVYALHYPLITIGSSVCSINKLTLDYSDVHFEENPLIYIDKSQYIQSHIQTLNGLHIGTLKLNSFNSANAKRIFQRADNITDPFYITVDEYIVTNSDYDWFDFPTSEENLIITKKGEIATEGSTSDRPEQCLCPYYSKYYDTDLSKTVVWTGEEWK